MNDYEKLRQEACDDHINVHDFILEDGLTGLYIDGNIALDPNIETDAERKCVLAEEIGHHYTSYGNILNQNDSVSRKQELKARLWGYNKIIGLRGLCKAYEDNMLHSVEELAEYFEVTEEYIESCIKRYRQKYGTRVCYGDYFIVLEPTVGVIRRI